MKNWLSIMVIILKKITFDLINLMSINDKMVVYIPSNLAYGQNGAGKVIPPNANLIFEFQLLEK